MKHIPLLFIFLVLVSGIAKPQDDSYKLTPEEVEAYKAQARSLISYFEGTLNFLGDPSSTTQEKEIIISESWAKIFVNDKVQVEDDLDENRDVPINKDVQAYLKDVDFFFHRAEFSFDIQSVEPMVDDKGALFFKATFVRHLNAVDLKYDTIRSTRLRYLEINLDPFKKDLKIASYYTTKLNEEQELRQWWTNMSTDWKQILGRDAVVFDTLLMANIEGIGKQKALVRYQQMVHRQGNYLVVDNDTLPANQAHRLFNHKPDTVIYLDDFSMQWLTDSISVNIAVMDNKLKQIVATTNLDVSNNIHVVDLEPLSQLTELTELNISNTPANSLHPLRNLSKLKILALNSTLVNDLSPLQYAHNIKELYFNNTGVDDIRTLGFLKNLEKIFMSKTAIRSLEPLANLPQLTVLKAANTLVDDLEPLAKLKELRILDLAQTLITDLQPLENLSNLQQLNVDKTLVSDLRPLQKLDALNLLQLNETKVTDLAPIENLKNLSRVYADQNRLKTGQVAEIMRNHPTMLIVFDSEELIHWWNGLPIYWRALLTGQAGVGAQPTTEELHKILNIHELDLSSNAYLQKLDPLSRLINLKNLSIAKTEVTELGAIKDLQNLVRLDISQTRIASLEELSGLFQLNWLNIENTRVENLEPLHKLKNLQLLLADNSRVGSEGAVKLKMALPEALIIYQTEKLTFWWNNLGSLWQGILANGIDISGKPDAMQLQTIADRRELSIENKAEISNLEPLMPLLMLEKLVVSGCAVNNLQPIESLGHLQWLELSGNPVNNLSPLAKLEKLTTLSLESTPVSDLTPIAGLTELSRLNIAGTQVKSLKSLANLKQLSELSLYNTRIKSLSPADKLESLKYLKCYNTKISKKAIDKLKLARPDLYTLFY